MATVTTVLSSLGGVFFIDARYDDVTWDFEWVRVRNTHLTRSYMIQIQRGNGQNWRDIVCGPGFNETFNSGGSIRNLVDDLPTWRAGSI